MTVKYKANCHPERPRYARGMCRSCFRAIWLDADGNPKPGVAKHNITGLRRLGQGLPRRVAIREPKEGVPGGGEWIAIQPRQHVIEIPERCPECSGTLTLDGLDLSCGCGWEILILRACLSCHSTAISRADRRIACFICGDYRYLVRAGEVEVVNLTAYRESHYRGQGGRPGPLDRDSLAPRGPGAPRKGRPPS